jgi:hypothetical protein
VPRKPAAEKKAAQPEPPAKKLVLKLPAGAKAGAALTCVYSKELSIERGLQEQEDDYYGTFHGVVDSIDETYLTITFVYPDGSEPTRCKINLETGIDETFEMAVDEIKNSPIPKAQLVKWKAKGLANASARPEEELEDGEEGDGEDDVPFKGAEEPDVTYE